MDYIGNDLFNLQNKIQSLQQNLSHNRKNTYVIRKLNPVAKESDLFLEKIRNYFNYSEKFLEHDYTMIINRKLRGPRYKNDKSLISHSVVCDEQLVGSHDNLNKVKPTTKMSRQSSVTSFKSFNKNNSILSTTKLKYTNNKKDETNQLEKCSKSFVSDNQIDSIYSKFSNYKYMNRNNVNNFLNGLPNNIKKEILNQEKILFANEMHNYDVKKISKILKYKLKSSKPEKFLLNSFHESILKKQAIDLIYKDKCKDLNSDTTDWILNLRKINNPKKRFNEVRFYPIGNDKWHMIRDFPFKEEEFTLIPGKGSINKLENNFKKYKNSQVINIRKLKLLKDINSNIIEGKDLLNEEIQLVKQYSGRKILHNKIEIDQEEVIIEKY